MLRKTSKQSILHKYVHTHFGLHRVSLTALIWFGVLLSGLSWQNAMALSLGKLRVLSEINEPLQADIQIKEDKAKDAEGAAISMVPPKPSEKYDQQYISTLQSLSFSAFRNADGQVLLQIRSKKPILQKQLDITLTLTEKGSTVEHFYHYVLNLGPTTANRTDTSLNRPSKPTALGNSNLPKIVTANAEEVQERQDPKKPAAANEAPELMTVQKGDSVGQIASRNLIDGVSLNQMLASIYFTNLHVFPERNINLIREGQQIKLPTTAQVEATTPKQITDVVQMLTEDFNRRRQELAQQSQALPETTASQTAKGKVSTLEVNDTLDQAPDKLTLSAPKDNAVNATATAEVTALAQQKQADQTKQRQAELEKNVRDLQTLGSNNEEGAPTEDPNSNSETAQELPADTNAVAIPIPTPKIEALAQEATHLDTESDFEKWLRWWPYAAAAVVLALVLLSLLRLLRSSQDERNAQGFVENDDPSPYDTPFETPPEVLATHDPAPPPSDNPEPLRFSVSSQHFDLSELDLDLTDPPNYKKVPKD